VEFLRGRYGRVAATSDRSAIVGTKTSSATVIILAVVALLSACSDRTPALGRGLPKTFGPAPYFDTQLRKRFPVGSDATKLVAELRNEGVCDQGCSRARAVLSTL
jgi:hypothetical protein